MDGALFWVGRGRADVARSLLGLVDRLQEEEAVVVLQGQVSGV